MPVSDLPQDEYCPLPGVGADRPTWDGTWLAQANIMGLKSLCVRARVGAYIVTLDNKVDSVSYNGPPPGFQHYGSSCRVWCPRAKKQPGEELAADYSDCVSSHAEQNAIARADHSAIKGGTIYVTSSICFACAKLIAAAGLARAVHVVRLSELHRHPDDVEAYLRWAGLTVERVNVEGL